MRLCLGGYREGETPGPIPNPEAKPLIADNTADFICGNVGRCLVCLFLFLFNPLITLNSILSCFITITFYIFVWLLQFYFLVCLINQMI